MRLLSFHKKSEIAFFVFSLFQAFLLSPVGNAGCGGSRDFGPPPGGPVKLEVEAFEPGIQRDAGLPDLLLSHLPTLPEALISVIVDYEKIPSAQVSLNEEGTTVLLNGEIYADYGLNNEKNQRGDSLFSKVPFPISASGDSEKMTEFAVAASGMIVVSDRGGLYEWDGTEKKQIVPHRMALPEGEKGVHVSAYQANWFQVSQAVADCNNAIACTKKGRVLEWVAPTQEFETGSEPSFSFESLLSNPAIVKALLGKKIIAVDATVLSSVFAATTNEVFAWGDPALRHLSKESQKRISSNQLYRIEMPNGASFHSMKAIKNRGNQHEGVNLFLLTEQGLLYEWGLNLAGHLGDGSVISRDAFALVKIPRSEFVTEFVFDTTAIAEDVIGYPKIFALTRSGRIYTWGSTFRGWKEDHYEWNQIRKPTQMQVKLPKGEKATHVAAGVSALFISTSSGALYLLTSEGIEKVWQSPLGENSIHQLLSTPCFYRSACGKRAVVMTVLKDGQAFLNNHWGHGSLDVVIYESTIRSIP